MKHLKQVNVEKVIENFIAYLEQYSTVSECERKNIIDMHERAAAKADTRRNAEIVAKLNDLGGYIDHINTYNGYCHVYFGDGSECRIRHASADALVTIKAAEGIDPEACY